MMGSYGYTVGADEQYKHTYFLIFHIFISNIFLLNYLIAILSTVYEVMNEQGDFAYKSFKYQYIERYLKGMENKGYSELVIHMPPVNYLTILLFAPALTSQIAMDRSSQVFSYIIFWFENLVFYVPLMMIIEIVLIPYIYIRMIINIMRAEDFIPAIMFSLAWMLIGLPYLLWTAGVDIYNYFKVLCDYREDEFNNETEKEDELQDKIVIYNELIDTIRAIKTIFTRKKNRIALKANVKQLK